MELQNIKVFMGVVLFVTGMATFWIGVIILLRTVGKDQRNMAAQAARLASKGLTDDMSGLVGNASNLLAATNELVRSVAGIGVFLVCTGLLQVAGAIWLVTQMPD